MSNTRRPKWSQARLDASNAEQHLAELAAVVTAFPPAARPLLERIWTLLDEEGRADELPALVEGFQAEAARQAVTARLAADLEADGHEPGTIAAMEQAVMELGDDYWAQMYRKAARDA